MMRFCRSHLIVRDGRQDLGHDNGVSVLAALVPSQQTCRLPTSMSASL